MTKATQDDLIASLEDELADALKRKKKTKCCEAHREFDREIAQIKKELARANRSNSTTERA